MKWLEIAVFTTNELIEVVANIFHEMGSGGVVIEDPALIVNLIENGNAETVAPTLDKTSEPMVKGYFVGDYLLTERLKELTCRFSELSVSWQCREINEEDWSTAWRAYYKPVHIGKRLIVKPSWEDYAAAVDEVVIDMDPGMAFGCGTHATTALCLTLLEELVQGDELVFDVGAGSGILSVTAALLGAARVTAVDIDELAVQATRENARRNGVADKVTVLQGDLLASLQGEQADVIIANIIADVIIRLAPDAVKALKPGGRIITSGIIRDRADEVKLALLNAGLIFERELTEGEWVAIVCVK